MKSRSLTAGEIDLARSIFGDSIDYSRVRLIKGKWWPFQPRNAAMAPMGNIYFHPDAGGWSDDFANEAVRRQAFFIHEMVHVWQAQAKGRFYLPLMRHPFCRYDYALKPGKAVRPLRARAAGGDRHPPLPRRPRNCRRLRAAARAAAVRC